MGERVQRRESCDARSEVGAYLYKTVMCEKSSVCSWANVAVPCGAVRGQRAERVVRSQWSGPNRSDAQKTRTVGIPSKMSMFVKTSGLDSHGGKKLNELQSTATAYRQEGKRRIA